MTARPQSRTPDKPGLDFEKPLWESGCLWVAGIDEAGRGALAGPVVAAAVILPADLTIASALAGVRDSKQMTPTQREAWAEAIRRQAIAWAIGVASVDEIDRRGIAPATRLAAQRALQGLSITPGHVLLDFIRLHEVNLPQTALIKGDQRCLSIASASVLAKTYRDALMHELEEQYPGYGFAQHKGYGTAAHWKALCQLGVSPVHRRSFRPVQLATNDLSRINLSKRTTL